MLPLQKIKSCWGDSIGDGWFWDGDNDCELMSSRSGWWLLKNNNFSESFPVRVFEYGFFFLSFSYWGGGGEPRLKGKVNGAGVRGSSSPYVAKFFFLALKTFLLSSMICSYAYLQFARSANNLNIRFQSICCFLTFPFLLAPDREGNNEFIFTSRDSSLLL